LRKFSFIIWSIIIIELISFSKCPKVIIFGIIRGIDCWRTFPISSASASATNITVVRSPFSPSRRILKNKIFKICKKYVFFVCFGHQNLVWKMCKIGDFHENKKLIFYHPFLKKLSNCWSRYYFCSKIQLFLSQNSIFLSKNLTFFCPNSTFFQKLSIIF